MKQVSFRVSEDDYNKLNSLRGSDKWHNFILNMLEDQEKESPSIVSNDTFNHEVAIDSIKDHLLNQMQDKHVRHQDQHDKLHERLKNLENYHHSMLRSIERLHKNKPVDFQVLKEKKVILNAIDYASQ